MSAFMVDDSTINQIIAHLSYDHGFHKRFLKEAGYDLDNPADRQNLAVRMFVLNKMGVEARYGRGEAKEFRPLDFQYRSCVPVVQMKAYKQLRCWLYQCSEGNVPNTRFYKLMDRLSDYMAHNIVSNMKEYDALPWR